MSSDSIEKLLKEFGLNQKEIAVYLACLKLGTSHASHIAKKAGLNRSSCYAVLEGLIKYGIVNRSGIEKKFKFTPETPERLILLAQEKQKKALDLEKKLKKLLPEIKSIYDTSETLPKIRFIEGVNGIKSIYDDALKALPKGGEYWHLNPDMESLVSLLGKKWVEQRIKERVRRGIKSKAIVEKNLWVEGEIKKDKRVNRETRLLAKGTKIPARLHIYNNKVAIFSLGEEPKGVLIEDKNVANLMRMLYQALWEKYKR